MKARRGNPAEQEGCAERRADEGPRAAVELGFPVERAAHAGLQLIQVELIRSRVCSISRFISSGVSPIRRRP